MTASRSGLGGWGWGLGGMFRFSRVFSRVEHRLPESGLVDRRGRLHQALRIDIYRDTTGGVRRTEECDRGDQRMELGSVFALQE